METSSLEDDTSEDESLTPGRACLLCSLSSSDDTSPKLAFQAHPPTTLVPVMRFTFAFACAAPASDARSPNDRPLASVMRTTPDRFPLPPDFRLRFLF